MPNDKLCDMCRREPRVCRIITTKTVTPAWSGAPRVRKGVVLGVCLGCRDDAVGAGVARRVGE